MTSHAGRALLAEAAASRGEPLHTRRRALERHAPPEQAALAFTQDVLRERAQRKMPFAELLLFDSVSLEQTSPWEIAQDRAARWPPDKEAVVVDAGAGLGLDAFAAATAGFRTVAFERHPARAALLAANAATLGLAEKLTVEAREFDPTSARGAYLQVDPDRRAESGGREGRGADPVHWDPPPATWMAWANEARLAQIRLAPSVRLATGSPFPREAPWEVVSLRGDAIERRYYLGPWEGFPPRRALALPSGLFIEGARENRGTVAAALPRYVEPGVWLLDADAAVHHAGLMPELAERHRLSTPHEQLAYLLGAAPVAEAPGTWLHVADVVRCRAREVQTVLDREGYGDLEIRKRGLDTKAEGWRRQLRPRGPNAGFLVLLAQPDGHWAACLGAR